MTSPQGAEKEEGIAGEGQLDDAELMVAQFTEAEEGGNGRALHVVNITSLLSLKAYPSFTQYSVGKSAREAYFRAFAAEHPKVRVLSYSPGPVDTQMHTEVSERSYDVSVRNLFSKRYEDSSALHRKLLSTEESVQRLIKIIEQDSFENGSRIDYFDK